MGKPTNPHIFTRQSWSSKVSSASIPMKPSEGRKLTFSAAIVLAALTAFPVIAQDAPPRPPLPPSPPTRIAPSRPAGFQRIPMAAPVPAQPIAPTLAPPSANPIQVGNPIPVFQQAGIAAAVPTTDPSALKWDAETKEQSPKVGDSNSLFQFWLTNVSSADVFVNSVRTSCGCTVAKLPAQPWRIPPGSNGPIDVTLSLAGKSGLIAKGVTVDTSSGLKQLTIKANIPSAAGAPAQVAGAMNDTERLKNMQLALADRQIVFKNHECATCHADPAKGKTDGRMVYQAVCSSCHNSHLRAAMVPDLRTLAHPTDAEHWRKWITYGRAGSMMPAFAESEGGPLNEQQINSLVDFMVKAFPNRPQRAALQPPGSAQAVPAVAPGSTAFPVRPN